MTVTKNFLSPGAAHGRTGEIITPKGIVIHYVGNPSSTAAANRNYFENGSNGNRVSAHYIIGLQGEIIQCLPENEKAQHAGKSYDAKYNATAGQNNSKYIGIENCHPNADGKFNQLTYASLIWLVADICLRYNFSVDNVFRHYDVSGKMCPKYYVDNPDAWLSLKNDVQIALSKSSTKTPIIMSTHTPEVGLAQLTAWAKSRNATQTFINLAKKYIDLSPLHGNVNPAAAYCQAAKETNYGRFTGVLDESFCNPCGLKTSSGGGDYDANAHQKFDCWDDGISAHLDHLALYAGAPGYPKSSTTDPRHFTYLTKTAEYFEDLGGKWAPSLSYGHEIISMLKLAIQTQVITDEDKLYFLIDGSDVNTPQYWVNMLHSLDYFDEFIRKLYDKFKIL